MGYVLLALIAMVFIGLFDFTVKRGIVAGADVNALMFYSFLASSVFYGITCKLQKVSFQMNKILWKYSLIAGFLFFFASFSIMTGLKYGDASIIIPIARMGFVVTSICAFIILKEKLSLQKGLGILCAIISLLLLTYK